MSEFKIQKAEGSYKLEDMQKRASVASTADGLTLEGPNFKLGCLTACPDMLLFACEELAKANERVRELESELDLRDVKIIDLQHQVGTLEFNQVTPNDLNKFAIEQQIKVLEEIVKNYRSYSLDGVILTGGVKAKLEQLRKEQGK